MKAIVYVWMLMFCLYGVPAEEWAAMSDAQQDAVLDELIQDTILELNCEEAEVSAFEEGKWTIIYGSCTDAGIIVDNQRHPHIRWVMNNKGERV